jgi:AcrR family transcriptional regulator
VSLRNVGAALKAGPMRLYGYLSTKEELLDLMVDAAYAEMDSGPPVRGSWREALRTSAHRVRSAARAHAWLVELLGGRPNQGPNALAHLEASLAVLSGLPGFEDIDTVIQAVGTVDAYVIGALRMEASELRAQAQSGLTEKEWQATTAPYIFSMLATGRFPQIDRVVRDSTDTPFEVMFDRGLECVLDGIAARLARS